MSQKRLTESPEKTKQQSAHRKSRPASARSFPGGLHPILQLQRTIGNRAVISLIHAKLAVSHRGDLYEQKADRVVEHVTSLPVPDSTATAQRQLMPDEEKDKQPLQTNPLAASIMPLSQRQAMPEEETKEEPPMQKKPLAESITPFAQRQMIPDEEKKEEQPVQMQSTLQRAAGAESGDAGADIDQQLGQNSGTGSPLPASALLHGARFGVDFSHVHVHSGSDDRQMNQIVGAQAFTHDSDIYFGAGSSPTNIELTAHELTHVVQQTGGAPIKTKKREEEVAPPSPEPSIQRICAACAAGDRKGSHPISAGQEEVVQRWGAKEHQLLGDKGSGHQNVELAPWYALSFGEVVALAGDHFKDIEQMRQFAENKKGGPSSRAEIEYALEWKLDKKGRIWDEKAKEAQEARYYTLAGENQSHFLNPQSQDVDEDPRKRAGDVKKYINAKYSTAPKGASQAYRMNHVWAIKEAVESAHQRGSLDKPMAVEAFGAHYLTDAFAAGHVRTARSSIKEYWDAKVPMFVYNLTGYIAQAVAENLGTWQKKVVPTDATMRLEFPFGLGALAQVEELLRTKRFTFGGVVGLALHDWDNEMGIAATINGIDVRLLGDGRLDMDENQAQPYAIKAVKESVLDIEQAFAMGHKGNDVNSVLDALLVDGLFAAEKWLPKPKSDAEQKDKNKSIKWDYSTVDELMASPRFQEAVKLFLAEKAGDLNEVAAGFKPDVQTAFKKGVVDKLNAAPVPTLMAVVQWVPSISKNKKWEAETAADYYHKAEETKGGTASLTLPQRVKLMSRLMHHSYGGKRELLGILTTATDSEARSLIGAFGWERLHQKIDERAMPFKDRFPRKKYER